MSVCVGWAHPRSRGEHFAACLDFLDLLGSSPLARGTPAVHEVITEPFGLIPARAGNTSFSSFS